MAVNPENFFNGDGSTTLFPFTFEYLEESDVKVSVDGTLKTQDTDYTFANATTISFNTAPASGSDNVRIYRDTNVDELKSTFFAGSAIRASDLNDNLTQNNYAVQEIKAYTWDNETDTIHSNETWVSSDTQIATTAAMDQRFQDEAAETITSAETWPDNDDTIATTAAIDNRIDTAITNDIGTDGTGITVTDDGDGTITLGLADNAIDFSKIKDADIITDTEQDAGSPSPTNDNLFSALGAARRFDTIVNQAEQSSAVNWEVGKTWLQNDSEKTVRIWDGAAWVAVASGGAFTTLPKVVYVDSVNGDDSLEGHRISNPKRTIKAAIQQINSETDEVGDGSVVIVAPGVYQEIAPIQIDKKNVSIIGQALRSCIVHPTVATETNTLFELNSGSYVANLTLTGMKAGTGTGNTVDATLPTTQGWNFAFRSGATITKSPYIQNCTNFSDSEIDNNNLNAVTPAGGAAGDTDSAPTGGGLLINGATVSSSSPLRSMVCDSYTHVGLNGPGILVTNNGYVQATSSYAFFNKYHIKCLNGGQANLAASTTDFGNQALVADGRSTTAIFTAALSTAAGDGDITFTIDEPTADASWHGTATRPQSNMLVELNSITYPVLSAVANGSGWDVTISRPNSSNRSENLGLNGAVSTPATASFFLRSQIASSGHTMEYVGSGTDYSALPENGGVPDDTQQVIELNDGKVWTAITDHNGKFTVGPLEVDQRTGAITIASGATVTNVVNDPSPQLGGDLDANGNDIILAAGTAAEPSLRFTGDADTGIYSPGADQVAISTNGTGRLFINSSGQIFVGQSAALSNVSGQRLELTDDIVINTSATGTGTEAGLNFYHLVSTSTATRAGARIASISTGAYTAGSAVTNDSDLAFSTTINGSLSEKLRITSDGKLGLGTSSPGATLEVAGSARFFGGSGTDGLVVIGSTGASNDAVIIKYDNANDRLQFYNWGASAANQNTFVIDNANSRVGIGTTSPGSPLSVQGSDNSVIAHFHGTTGTNARGLQIGLASNVTANHLVDLNAVGTYGTLTFSSNSDEKARIDSSGRLLFGTSTAVNKFDANKTPRFQVEGTNLEDSSISITRWNSGNIAPPALFFGGTNSATRGVYTLVDNNEELGEIRFEGTDGSKFVPGVKIAAVVDGTPGADDMPGRLVFSTTAASASSPTERMRITSTGETDLYTTTSFNLRTNRDQAALAALNVYKNATSTATGTICCQIRADGDLLNTNGAYDAISDAKLKENIVDANSQWDDIKAVRIRNWNFKEETGYGTHTQIGTIAQELELVSPGLVRDTPDTDEDGNDLGTTTKSVKNSILYMKAVKALQEAMERIEQLEARLAALEAN